MIVGNKIVFSCCLFLIRLSTVVPKLVLFISDLANWYCRLNRPRLKGAEGNAFHLFLCSFLNQIISKHHLGVDAQQNSLDTLYTVLLTLCAAMAPFSPYFVEHVYQNLRLVQPESQRMGSMSSSTELNYVFLIYFILQTF